VESVNPFGNTDTGKNLFTNPEDKSKVVTTSVEPQKVNEKKEEKVPNLNEPIKPPQLGELDELNINNTMKKSVEDVINKWKREMDRQVSIFNQTSEKLQNFEYLFQNNYDNVLNFCFTIKLVHIHALIETIESQSLKSEKEVQEILTEEV